ncbi:MAG: hypothetical protein WCG80_01815 [Spirochaetales bacterium]
MRNKVVFALVSLALFSGVSTGFELQRGKIKLNVGDKNGRMTVIYTDDIANPVPVALYSSDDPATSKIKIQLGDKVSVLGEDSTYVPVAETTAVGGKIVWTGKTLKVTQTFEFLTSAASSVADGVKETLSLTNLSDTQTLRPAVRVGIDTNLGEKKDHFKLSGGETVNSESKLEGNLPDWWVSPSSTDEKIGLLMMLGKGATTPSRLVFANWKRLDDASWEMAFRQGRDFNQLPYSYNDSAVAQYYDAQDLAPGASRDIVLMFGNRSAITFAGAKVGTANVLSDLLQESRTQEGGGASLVKQDLQSLENLMTQINAKLVDATKVTDEDLKLFKAILEQLESHKSSLTTPAAAAVQP